jgi:hypothetical protein
VAPDGARFILLTCHTPLGVATYFMSEEHARHVAEELRAQVDQRANIIVPAVTLPKMDAP